MNELTFDAKARSHLVLPLRGQDLGINSRNLNTGVEAGLVMCLHNISAVHFSGTDTAIVRALRSRETTLWPCVGLVVKVK